MAFTAGYANGVCLSGFLHVGEPYVTHPVAGVTNLFTESAISLLNNNMQKYSFQVGTIMSTMAGSCISALMNPRPVPFILSPRYGPTFIIGSIFSTLGAVAAVGNGRREFHFTSVGCGIMNGVTSMYSANLIRVSSFSGPVTGVCVCSVCIISSELFLFHTFSRTTSFIFCYLDVYPMLLQLQILDFTLDR